MSKPTIICLTPVKNEAWILERFLACASTWADHIIVLDQNSDDGSPDIARKFPKVHLMENKTPHYDESGYRLRLFEEARKFPGPRLLIGLDADEVISANHLHSPEWRTMLNIPLGSCIAFDLVQLMPDMEHCWISPEGIFGFMDDGSPHAGEKIHAPRTPQPEKAPWLCLKELKVLHYQYSDWDRMLSKHRWYQCWETLNMPQSSPYGLYRKYHHMDSVRPDEIQPVLAQWLQGYIERGIDMSSLNKDPIYRWDQEVMGFFQNHGTTYFSKLDLWDIDWVQAAHFWGLEKPEDFGDPRSFVEKAMHKWLRRSQKRVGDSSVGMADACLKRLPGW